MRHTVCDCGEKLSTDWIVCPKCAHPLDEARVGARTLIRCSRCASSISPETQICPGCRGPVIRRYCSSCRRLIPDQADPCPYCQAAAAAKRSVAKTYARYAVLLLPFCIATTLVPSFFGKGKNMTRSPSHYASSIRNHEKPSSDVSSPPATHLPPRATPIANVSETSQSQAVIPQEIPGEEISVVMIPEEMAVQTPASQEATSDTVETTIQMDPATELTSRGARLMQGRKLNTIGSRLIRQERYADAIPVLEIAIQTFPPETNDLTYGDTLFNLGYSLRKAGKPEQAIPVLKKALRFSYYRSRVMSELQSATEQRAAHP